MTVLKYLVPDVVVAEPVNVITSVCASPFTSVPVIVTVLPLSPVPAVVQVIILAAVNVAVPPEVSVPPIVKSVFACSAIATWHRRSFGCCKTAMVTEIE